MKKKEIEFVKGKFKSNDKLIEFMDANHLDTHDLSVLTGHSHPTVKNWVTGQSMIQMWRAIDICEKLTAKINQNAN